MKNVVILHNIVSPYKTLLFNELNKNLGNTLMVFYFAETALEREWDVDYTKLNFRYKILNKGALNKISQKKLALQVYKRLQMMKKDISVVIAGEYNGAAYWIALYWCKKNNIPFGSIMESTQKDHDRIWFKELVKRYFFSCCSFVFAAGSLHKLYAKILGVKEERVHIIGGVGGVDREIYDDYFEKYSHIDKNEIQRALNLPLKKYFIYVGRFSPEKNLISLLKAYRNIRKSVDGWGLLLVGSGEQRIQLDEYIAQNNIKNVIFSGFVQQNKLPLYYLASDVFILPSNSEPWGLVVDEAINMGLPVLVSNVCGCAPELVEKGMNGYVFAPNDLQTLEEKMVCLAKNPRLVKDFSVVSRKLSRSFSPASSAKIMSDVIGSVLR